ncbi:DTX3L [Branchiostoma lanceolatum]|uniref:RING-type E3 ubiquitin transferase n=1 Tax=Branchiostoma lanceolatum TaxID=7740 RepID=A0A8K0A2V2_BRALA|nr:DTX3L [Branchiostoma lanceolatum]
MACARGAKKEDETSELGNSRLREGRDQQRSEDEASRSILVSNIPEGVTRDKLEIHFMRESNGGSEVNSVTMLKDTEAKITYLDGAAVKTVLERPQVLNGVEVKVQKWTPPEDDTKKVIATAEQDARSILVSNIPAGVNRDKLEIHFMRTCNGGSEIESITMVTDTEANITYLDGAAVERVLARPHVLNGVEVGVQKWPPPVDETKVGATAVENSRSILVSNIPEGVTSNELEEHFMEVSNGGGEIESVDMVTETVAIITYLDSAVVKTVLGKQHVINGIQLTVQEDDDPEVFDVVHATVDGEAAKLIPQDQIDKVKKETGIQWEKGVVDGDIEVKGTYKQVAEAQQLLQDWLKQHMEQGRESPNDPATTAHKDSKTTNDMRLTPNNGPKKTKAIRVTGLPDKSTGTLNMDHQSTSMEPSDEGHLNLNTVSKDGECCKEGRERDGVKPIEDAAATMAIEDEDNKGTSSQEENTGEIQMERDHTTEGEDDEGRDDDKGQPQQTGGQEGDAAKTSPADGDTSLTSEDDRLELASTSELHLASKGEDEEQLQQTNVQEEDTPADGDTASTSEEDRLNSASGLTGTSNEEASSRGSADKDEGIKAGAEEPEQMDTEEGPLSDNDEPMLSDNDDPQTLASNNSSLSKEPRKGAPSNPTDDAGSNDDQAPGDQSIARDVQAQPADTTDGNGENLKPTKSDASLDDSTTTGCSQNDGSPHNDDAEPTQSSGPKRQKRAFYKENLGKNPMPVDQQSSGAAGNLPTSKDHRADCNAGSTRSNQENNSLFEVFVDPDVLTYIRHKHHAEISDIGKRYKSVFHTSDDNTKACFVPASPSVGKDPEPEKANDEFITLYQKVFSKITCENFDVVQYNFAPIYLLNGVRSIRVSHDEVLTNVNKDNTTVTFMGEPEKVREARVAFCGMMGISISRGSRRRGNNPSTSAESAGSTTDAPKGAEGGENSPVVLFTHTFEQGVEVRVAHGNITTLKVDAIVNAADACLKHGGGVAKAIVQAGGDIIQEESTEKMKTRGILRPTETEITGAGCLPCKHIIHAHGPQWQASQARQCSDMLTKTCINILQAAEGLKAESVAIPAISSGKYGMPKQYCAQALLAGVLEYLSTKHTPSCSLRNIWFIDMTGETIEVLVDVFEISVPKTPSGYGKAKYKPTVKHNSGASNPPQSKTYASAAAAGINTRSSPARGQAYRNDSSQVAALIAPRKGPGLAHQMTQDRSSQQAKGGATGGGNDGTTRTATRSKKTEQPNTGKDKNDEECPICLSVPTNPQSLPCKAQGCKAVFCKKCLDKAMKVKSCCPVCSAVVGKLMGNQPEGKMKVSYNRQFRLGGYKSTGVIVIDYIFKDGIQGQEHPNPGKPYKGTTRTAYLPHNTDGIKVLSLLKQAFNQKLTFTIGTSSTTGQSDTVVWNDIHHKTSLYGGPSMHGYPDPGYLKRVTEELAAKGIK